MQGARLVVVGVDGLDYDAVLAMGAAEVPTLHGLVDGSSPHASVFPPDSVPSWTTILTGLAPGEHQQMSNVQQFLEDLASTTVTADVNRWADRCFWEEGAPGDVAVINPFLAYPPWAAREGAMVSGHPFEEQEPLVADPRGLLTDDVPPRMGGFTKIPHQSELRAFVDDTLAVGQAQYDYALRQLRARRWGLFFFTTLVVDRVEHYTWRHWDRADPLHSSRGPTDAIPRAHRQLDEFLSQVVGCLQPGNRLVLLSDHGHGRRAAMGVNLHEYLRRKGLFRLAGASPRRRATEFAKTFLYSVAPRVRMEAAAIRLAQMLPSRKAMKAGTFIGAPTGDSAQVVDLAGSNPFGGVRVQGAENLRAVQKALLELRYRERPVFRWVAPAVDALGAETVGSQGVYPELLFEMEPEFGPTWNLFGPVFSPVLTRRRQSGGHTRRGVVAGLPALPWQPQGSLEVNTLLRELIRELDGTT